MLHDKIAFGKKQKVGKEQQGLWEFFLGKEIWKLLIIWKLYML